MKTSLIFQDLGILIALIGALSSCGGAFGPLKSNGPVKKSTPTRLANQNAVGTTTACISAVQCPQAMISLSGISSLGAPAEALLMWDVGGVTPEEKSRQVMVVMQSKLAGMEVISKPSDLRVSVNWKPLEPQTGVMQFRARDVTRCQRITGGALNCLDMSIPQPQFEQILTAPYQIVPKGATFDPIASPFFKQFHCESQGLTNAEKAILAGGGILGDAAGSAINDKSMSQGNIKNGVATIVDYLANGNEKPLAYECLKRNSAQQQSVQTSNL